MNNADFDTLSMTPRPCPAPQRPRLPTPPNTSNPRRGQPKSHKPPLKHHSTAPAPAPGLTTTIRNLPDLQGIHRHLQPALRSLQESRTRDRHLPSAARPSPSRFKERIGRRCKPAIEKKPRRSVEHAVLEMEQPVLEHILGHTRCRASHIGVDPRSAVGCWMRHEQHSRTSIIATAAPKYSPWPWSSPGRSYRCQVRCRLIPKPGCRR